MLVLTTKVKACKSFLFTEKLPSIENKEHLVDFVVTFILLAFCFDALCSSKVSLLTLAKKDF